MSNISNKKPSLIIPIDRILLDSENPRIAAKSYAKTQHDLLIALYNDFSLGEIAGSMAVNGYFEEEPIVVIPEKEINGLDWNASPKSEIEHKLLTAIAKDKDFKFIVLEGNRRVSTAKILTDADLRSKIKNVDSLPIPESEEIIQDLSQIPAIIYQNRDSVISYLGVRHIVGVKKWETYSQIKYTADVIETLMAKGESLETAISTVQKRIGDRSDKIKKQYIYYLLLRQIEKEDLGLDINKIKNRFSVLMLAFGRPSIRDFVGFNFDTIQDKNKIVPQDKIDNLYTLLVWIYGDDSKNKDAIITDSRKISTYLAPILKSKEATAFLKTTGSLLEAFELSDGEKEFTVKNIDTATKNIQKALSLIYKFTTDTDVSESIDELKKAVDALSSYIQPTRK